MAPSVPSASRTPEATSLNPAKLKTGLPVQWLARALVQRGGLFFRLSMRGWSERHMFTLHARFASLQQHPYDAADDCSSQESEQTIEYATPAASRGWCRGGGCLGRGTQAPHRHEEERCGSGHHSILAGSKHKGCGAGGSWPDKKGGEAGSNSEHSRHRNRPCSLPVRTAG